jgi:mRNA degradation ribonuclease J1/J2
MAQEGMVVAVLCCARVGDGPPAPPQLHTHGLDLDGATLASLAAGLAAEIGRATPVARHDPDWLRSTMTAWLRSELRRRTRRRPAVVALVMEQ